MLEDLTNAPKGSVILLHACAHNPTGVDPTMEEWKVIADKIKEKGHFPLFDSAYQGFASGDLDKDAAAVRFFAERGFELFVAQSFAKNFGLYGERAGALHVVVADAKTADPVHSQLNLFIRSSFSNPPKYGALIVAAVLKDKQLYAQWQESLRVMAGRIINMRELLYEALKKRNTPGDWKHIISQIGMFSYTGLTAKHVQRLIKEFHVYLLSNGRISMAGLSASKVDYLADAIHAVVTGTYSSFTFPSTSTSPGSPFPFQFTPLSSHTMISKHIPLHFPWLCRLLPFFYPFFLRISLSLRTGTN